MKVMTAKKATKDLAAYSADSWAMEPKLDGFRATIRKSGREVTILSRTGKDQGGKLPHIEKAISDFSGPDFVLDGELLWFTNLVKTPQGLAPIGDFNRTMRIMGSNAPKAQKDQANGTQMVFFAFDVLEVNGASMMSEVWTTRREWLEAIVGNLGFSFVALSPVFDPDPNTYDAYVAGTGEGMMLKRRDAAYAQKRSGDLLKVKVEHTLDAVVIGFKEGEGKYSDTIGALEFGLVSPTGKLVSAGFCSGMDDETRYAIGANREAYLGRVIEVKHFGLVTEAKLDGLRHPNFIRFRDDKAPADCTVDQLD